MGKKSEAARDERLIGHFQRNFKIFSGSLNGLASERVHELRKASLAHLVSTGFPAGKDEEWKYTSAGALLKENYTLPGDSGAQKLSRDDLEGLLPELDCGARLVFVNGLFCGELSFVDEVEEGVNIASLSAELAGKNGGSGCAAEHIGRYAPYTGMPFVALNTAFMKDGAFIHLLPGRRLKKPVHLVYIGKADREAFHTNIRTLFLLEKESSASVVESSIGFEGKGGFTGSVCEISLSENASLEYCRVQNESAVTSCHSSVHVHQGSGSTLKANLFCFGGSVVRNEIHASLDGENIQSFINGLAVAGGAQHIDNKTVVDHRKPNCESTQLYKGIYGGKAQGVFDGSIIVRKDAQKTNAVQNNKSLLLSREAASNSKPQLKIWADDVKCTHGATIGQLDEDALFYIRSRGVGEKDAQKMLIHAFASEVVSGVRISEIEPFLEGLLMEKLGLI